MKFKSFNNMFMHSYYFILLSAVSLIPLRSLKSLVWILELALPSNEQYWVYFYRAWAAYWFKNMHSVCDRHRHTQQEVALAAMVCIWIQRAACCYASATFVRNNMVYITSRRADKLNAHTKASTESGQFSAFIFSRLLEWCRKEHTQQERPTTVCIST